jgi:hypothetical protein
LTDGKFGTHLFPNKIIEINFDEKLLIVHNKLPDDLSGFEKMDLVFNRSMMFIKGKCQIGEQLFDNQFLIHSGYSKTILFDDQFVSQHQLGSELKTVKVTELKDSFGNILKTKESILPKLVFGNNEFGSIPVGLFEGAIGRQKMSVVGGDILKRFNIILDTQNAYVYLKPSSMFSDEFEKG